MLIKPRPRAWPVLDLNKQCSIEHSKISTYSLCFTRNVGSFSFLDLDITISEKETNYTVSEGGRLFK